jgi:hypothetical protein
MKFQSLKHFLAAALSFWLWVWKCTRLKKDDTVSKKIDEIFFYQ